MLQAQLTQARAKLAHSRAVSRSFIIDQWQTNAEANPNLQSYSSLQSMSPQSSRDCSMDGLSAQGVYDKEELPTQACAKRRAAHCELGELQALALKMMKS